jgi:hypothetical protein
MQLESKPIDAVQIFADGELLIVATAISAAAVGELIVSTSKARIFKIICGTCSVVAIGMSTFIFAVVKAKSGIVEIPSSVTVVNWSLGIFLIAFITGGSGIMISGAKNGRK